MLKCTTLCKIMGKSGFDVSIGWFLHQPSHLPTPVCILDKGMLNLPFTMYFILFHTTKSGLEHLEMFPSAAGKILKFSP